MTTVFFDRALDDDSRREAIYAGHLLVYSPRRSSLALVEFARSLIDAAFGGLDPRRAQYELPVERYVEILSRLKPTFINHPTSKELLRALLIDMRCDPEKTYFDVPRMRTATSDNYLTAGIAYAFHPHRDTWYSAPMCQINWWLPIYEIRSGNAMAFHLKYWYTPVANESADFHYEEYVRTARKDAAKYVQQDTRKQPHARTPIELDPQLRVVTDVGGLLLFSAAHLHSTVPNATGETRFSIDFRTIHLDDVVSRAGAPNLDSECTGTALTDFLRVSDFDPFPRGLCAAYEKAADIRPSPAPSRL